ncbi:type I restriction-modification system subunit M N-terminal domain-containing protein [Bacillus sp. N9]
MSEQVTQQQNQSGFMGSGRYVSGKIDSSTYKDYILTMLFIKYLSDAYKEHLEEYTKRYDGDEQRIKRALSRERFVLDEHSTFDYLYSNRNDAEIGQIINKALEHLEDENTAKLRGYSAILILTVRLHLGKRKNVMPCYGRY